VYYFVYYCTNWSLAGVSLVVPLRIALLGCVASIGIVGSFTVPFLGG
jgi:hypothetical protein